LASGSSLAAVLAVMTAPMVAQRLPRPPEPAAAPAAERRAALVVNDRTAPNAVIQVNGRTYVELDALARVTNASVSFQPDRIVVRLPGPAVAGAIPPTDELSKEFARAAILQLAKSRAWKEAVMLAIQLGVPAGSWSGDYRSQTQQSLQLAGVAVSTPGDRKTMQLLQSQVAHLDQWENDITSTRAAMIANQSIDPNAVRNDSRLASISACQDFLSTVIVNRMYAEDVSCR
jgi:hypothetical protein